VLFTNNVQCRYLSVLIRDHVIHPNTSVTSVNSLNSCNFLRLCVTISPRPRPFDLESYFRISLKRKLPRTWSGSVQRCNEITWPWPMTLTFDLDLWPWPLTFDIDLWPWEVKLTAARCVYAPDAVKFNICIFDLLIAPLPNLSINENKTA